MLPPFQNGKENVSPLKTTFGGYENDSELFFFFYISVLIPSFLVLLYNNRPRMENTLPHKRKRTSFQGIACIPSAVPRSDPQSRTKAAPRFPFSWPVHRKPTWTAHGDGFHFSPHWGPGLGRSSRWASNLIGASVWSLSSPPNGTPVAPRQAPGRGPNCLGETSHSPSQHN